jgi:chaperonin GroEL (HSP60 family)
VEEGIVAGGGVALLRAIEGTLREIVFNAASVASLMLTTECMIAKAPKADAPMPIGGGDMGGMGM